MENSDNSLIIGITGGIGSGKSTVAERFASHGYPVLSMDDSAKELMAEVPELKEQLIEAFGKETYLEDGSVNKTFLAKEVFSPGHSAQLSLLNSIVHPHVIQKMIDDCEDLMEEGKSIIFVESALLYEAGLEDGFDYVIVVDAPEELRIDRASKKYDVTREEIIRRITNQISVQQKIGAADFVIDNSKSLDELEKAIDFILAILPSLPPKSFEEGDEDLLGPNELE